MCLFVSRDRASVLNIYIFSLFYPLIHSFIFIIKSVSASASTLASTQMVSSTSASAEPSLSSPVASEASFSPSHLSQTQTQSQVTVPLTQAPQSQPHATVMPGFASPSPISASASASVLPGTPSNAPSGPLPQKREIDALLYDVQSVLAHPSSSSPVGVSVPSSSSPVGVSVPSSSSPVSVPQQVNPSTSVEAPVENTATRAERLAAEMKVVLLLYIERTLAVFLWLCACMSDLVSKCEID
jgi:hypothetical protein